jgi:protein arginine kinase activator
MVSGCHRIGVTASFFGGKRSKWITVRMEKARPETGGDNRSEPMMCDVCQTETASVFLTQIVDGNMQKVNLCGGCSKEKGVTDPTGFALADLLLGMGAAQAVERSSAAAAPRCPNCAFTEAELKKTGRLGCSACYGTFAESLGGILRGMHKGVRHTGKVPVRLERKLARDNEIRCLSSDLRRAVVEEQYETAAALRDKIRALESERENGVD